MLDVARALEQVIRSARFAADLRELSEYAARIKQERPVVLLCAKHLWRAGHDVIVEGGRDLSVDKVAVEFKHHFDWDIPRALAELRGSSRERKGSWRVLPGLRRDLLDRRPDLFLWIVSERSLDDLESPYCEDHVCFWRQQRHYARKWSWSSERILAEANRVLDSIGSRHCRRSSVSVKTNGHFASTYHFLIRDFRKG
jgi:hypothetical protein